MTDPESRWLLCVHPCVFPAASCDTPGTHMKHGPTVLLYFLPLNRLKATVDLPMIQGIADLVAWVPIIAKADTYTHQELEAYRTIVKQVGHLQAVYPSACTVL